MGKTPNKILSSFNLVVIVVILVSISLFILISSGLFDGNEVKANQHSRLNSQNSNSPSVNLNAVNEINRLEEILKSNPNNHEVLLRLGHLLNDNGYYDRAINKYETYLKDHPDNVDVIIDMGVCYFELKQYDKAISVIERGLKLDPKHQIANFNLGIVNLANNNKIEAVKWWEKAKDIDPNSSIGIKAEELLKSNK